jgi:ribosome maturation factor RimP
MLIVGAGTLTFPSPFKGEGIEFKMASLEKTIAELIMPTLADMGYELVRVQMSGGKTRPVLQIMAEPADGRLMNVDDCTLISQQVSALLDVNDTVPGAYVLEVSSPGIDRPLTRIKDFEKWQGHEALIETHDRIENRARFRGVFTYGAAAITIAQDGKQYEIPYTDIRKAKLVLTDELIKQTQHENLLPLEGGGAEQREAEGVA